MFHFNLSIVFPASYALILLLPHLLYDNFFLFMAL